MTMPSLSVGRASAAGFLLLALSVAPAARAGTVYDSNFGAENGGDPLAAAGPILADRFVSSITGTISSVRLNLMLSGAPGTGFTVDLFADNGAAGPGAATVIASVNDSLLSSIFALYTFMPSTPISVVAGQSYYIGISGPADSNAVLGNTVDQSVLSRPSVVAGAVYYNNGGVQANAGGPYEISVNVTPAAVPEPASLALMIVGLAAMGATCSVRRSTRGPLPTPPGDRC